MTKTPFSFYKIRFSDCDPLGHLNSARYIDYFLNAREDHLKNAYDIELSKFYKQGLGWVVGNHEISYLRPVYYNEIVHIQSALVRAADNFIFIEMQMMDEKQTQIKALLWTSFIPVNLRTGEKQNHSPDFMDFIKAIELTGAEDKRQFRHTFQGTTDAAV